MSLNGCVAGLGIWSTHGNTITLVRLWSRAWLTFGRPACSPKNERYMLYWLTSLLPSSRKAYWQPSGGEAVLTINIKNKIINSNGDIQSLFGASGADLRGQSIYRQVCADDQDALAEVINYTRRTGPVGTREAARTLGLTLANKAGNPPKRAQIRLQALSRHEVRLVVLQQAEGASSAEEQTQGQAANTNAASFDMTQLADLSHEMKTPLNAILGFADTMREQTFGPLGHARYEEYADHIHTSGEHLMGLISTILDVSRHHTSQVGLTPKLCDISTIIDACVVMLRPQIETAGLKLSVALDETLPEMVLDAQAVRQIVLNLVSNAIKFTSDGQIMLRAAQQDGQLVLTVSDTGIGMSDEQIAKLGKRFTTEQADGVRGTAGHGLGLSLASSLVSLHGGELALASAPGEGLTATVTLPIQTRPYESCSEVEQPAGLRDVTHEEAPIAGGRSFALETQMERINDYRRKVADRDSDAA